MSDPAMDPPPDWWTLEQWGAARELVRQCRCDPFDCGPYGHDEDCPAGVLSQGQYNAVAHGIRHGQSFSVHGGGVDLSVHRYAGDGLPAKSPERRIGIVWRVRIFITVVVADAVIGLPSPWPVIIGAVTYIVVVMPSLIYDRTGEGT